MFVDIRDDTLSVDAVLAKVTHSAAGATCVFVGSVRDSNDGRPVVLLEYEAYRPMALAEIERVAGEIESGMKDVRVAAAHRVGSLRVGDLAVVCAASAPHREEAYVACRRLIEGIKHRAPIWKREHGPEGAYWVGWQDARCGHGG